MRSALPSRPVTTTLALLLFLALLAPDGAKAEARRGLRGFLRRAKAPVGQQTYCAGVRVPRPLTGVVTRVARALGLQDAVVQRRVVQITNQTLGQLTRATDRGYLEVVVPANKGHVYFRHGQEVFDFYQGGFRCGEVRPIKSERYGMLVKLTRAQERRLTSYLAGLKASGGAELGDYDFTGHEGFHCVSWLLRAGLDEAGHNLAQVLGSRGKRASGMPNFSRFMLKRARQVEAVLVYQDEPRTPSQLDRMRFQLMSNRGIVRAYRAEQREAAR